MQSLHNLLVKRRSIRRFTSQPVDPESARLILEAALLSPTSKNTRAWHFTVVEDPDTLARLADCKSAGASLLAGCAMAVVVAMDTAVSEAWIEDASIAAMSMMLQATDLGLGSCWVEVRGRTAADGTPSEDVVRDILGLPHERPVVCIVAIGHPEQERQPQNVDKLLWENVSIHRCPAPPQA